jgi:hypothetical protein
MSYIGIWVVVMLTALVGLLHAVQSGSTRAVNIRRSA